MIVEDNEGFALVLCELLNQSIPEMKTLVARTIEEGQTLASEFVFQLFIIDINLPDGNGFDFLCDLRTVQPEAKALIMTAAPLPEYRNHAQSLGALHFFEKPFDFRQFTATLRNLLFPEESTGVVRSFQGTLRDLQMVDVVQIKCISRANSRLLLEGPNGEIGEIHVHRGNIVHATTGAVDGEDAFEQMLGWPGGRFLEGEPLPDPPRTIELDWQMLLMDTARKLDETRGASQNA